MNKILYVKNAIDEKALSKKYFTVQGAVCL